MTRFATPGMLPRHVQDALGRVAELISHDNLGWTVAGRRIPADVPNLDPMDLIAEALYDCWYTRASDSASLPPPAPSPLGRSLLGVLRAAHAGVESTETGWVVTAVDPGGTVTAVRNGQTRTLRPGDSLLRTRPGAPPAPGEPVEPVARRDHLDVERGLWWTYSEFPPNPPLGRVYLNPRPATLPRVVHGTTGALLPTGLSFQLKCPEFAVAASRVDALVAYHTRSDRQPFLAALLDRWPSLEPLLDPDVPPLTCAVRPAPPASPTPSAARHR
jgi:hypothetical protein